MIILSHLNTLTDLMLSVLSLPFAKLKYTEIVREYHFNGNNNSYNNIIIVLGVS